MRKETKRLDELDRRIIGSLLDDSRFLMRSLASRPGARSAIISARIRSLEAGGVVKRYVPKIDFRKIGYKCKYMLFLKLATKIRWEDVLPPIAQMRGVSMLSLLSGEYDMLVEITARDEESVSGIIEKIQGMGITSDSTGFAINERSSDTHPRNPLQ